MSRKDYVAIAKTIAQAYADHGQTVEVKYALSNVASELAILFKRDNAAFDATRFHNACKLEG